MIRYLTLDLLNDHDGKINQAVLIGVVSSSGAVPQVVACFPKADYRKRAGDYFCLNEVALTGFTKPSPHLTRTSVVTVSGEHLADLQETGRVQVGGAVVRLVLIEEEPVTAACGHPSTPSPVDGAPRVLCDHCIGRSSASEVVAAIDASVQFAPKAAREAMLRARALLVGKE